MSPRAAPAYHPSGLEGAIFDLVRVGSAGQASGVRQLASRLIREVPEAVSDPIAFQREVHRAMASKPATELRFAGGALPKDSEGVLSLVEVDPHPDGSLLAVDGRTRDALKEIVAERRSASKLAAVGLGPTRAVLLSGPPGVGKTLSAQWLAQELQVPLVSLNLAATVSSYLGTSGRNIRAVLEYAKSGECVLLLDEFDAIAPRRDDGSDVGELRRLVNVVLVELDRWPETSLLVAATNHAQLLDPAVGRRFDRLIDMGLPSESARSAILRGLARSAGVAPSSSVIETLAAISSGMSGSDLARMWRTALRASVVGDSSLDDLLLASLLRDMPTRSESRDIAMLVLHDKLGWSNRKIAEIADTTHPTVGAAVERARGKHERGRGRSKS